ncbi:MAG: hypothetical protein E7311_07035 [Clostridiales bacterium]|nr:hypothetical protein [Clostridiales bacterium]
MKWIKNKLEEQEGWDNVDFSKARKGFNMLLLLDVGYILSFIGSNIVTGLDYDQLISIIVFIVLIAILYALRPNKKAKAGWIESKEKELTKATEKVKKGGDIDH